MFFHVVDSFDGESVVHFSKLLRHWVSWTEEEAAAEEEAEAEAKHGEKKSKSFGFCLSTISPVST